MGKLVRETAWLPDGLGGFVPPSELSLDDLPEDFRRDTNLANALGMRTSFDSVIEALRVSGTPESLIRPLEMLVNCTPEERERVVNIIQDILAKEQETVQTLGPEEYPSELKNVFDQPNLNLRRRPDIPDFPEDKTIEDRRVDTEIDIDSEPDVSELYKLRLRRNWNAKNPETRSFLRNEYGGECQICGDSFPKRDGEQYFEAVHIVPRTSAQFFRSSAECALSLRQSRRAVHAW